MPDRPLRITAARFTPACRVSASGGLLGWVSIELEGALGLDGLAIRRTRDGRASLSFPRRRDRSGREHPLIRPLGDAVRRDLEAQVLRALGDELDLAGLPDAGLEAAE